MGTATVSATSRDATPLVTRCFAGRAFVCCALRRAMCSATWTRLSDGSSRPVPRWAPSTVPACAGTVPLPVPGRILALRELEAAARLRPAVLLALDDAGVAGEEAFALDRGAQRRLVAGQRGRDAVADRARLARQAAALDGGFDVILALAN